MYSIAFPDMFNHQKCYLIQDDDANYSNLRLLLLSDKLSLLGDPYYGTNIKRLLYNQSSIIKDLIIDDIYRAVVIFMPQLTISRDNIDIYVENKDLYVSMSVTNKKDYVNNLYIIRLTSEEQ